MKIITTLLILVGILAPVEGGDADQSTRSHALLPSSPAAVLISDDPRQLIAVREIKLKDGADAAAFERFAAEEYMPTWRQYVPGVKVMIMKGERGEKVGQYLHFMLFDSIDIRNLYAPTQDQTSEIWEVVSKASGGAVDRVEGVLADFLTQPVQYTDYVAIQ